MFHSSNEGFDFPNDLNHALSLLNGLFGDGMSLIDTDGTIYCSPEDREKWRTVTFPNDTGRVLLYLGNWPLGPTFSSLAEARPFLMGIHFAYYGTASVDRIEAFVSRQRTFSPETDPERAVQQWVKEFWRIPDNDPMLHEEHFP